MSGVFALKSGIISLSFLAIFLVLTNCSDQNLVQVTRSEFNTPQIRVLNAKASKNADYSVYFQQGFEQASDRLIQMDSLR